MQTISLPRNRAKRAALLILSLLMLGMTNTFGRTHAPDWSEPCPTGQTLYYYVVDANNHYVGLTHPGPNNSDPWAYTVNEGGQSVTYHVDPVGQVELPAYVTHEGVTYTLTEIDTYAFYACTRMTGALVIPNTVTHISDNAFDNCTNITSLVIGNSVTYIGQRAFRNCPNLSGTLEIPSSIIELGAYSFQNCSGFNKLVFNEGLLKINQCVFQDCSGFTGSLILPNSLTFLGTYVFQGCSGFNGELKLSDNITMVPQACFDGCTNLKGDLVLPKKITKVHIRAFYNCKKFTAIYICSNAVPNKGSENNSFYGISKNIPVYVPSCLVSDYTTNWSGFGFTNYIGRSFYNTEGNWSNPENWACGVLPTEGMDVIIAGNCNLNESVNYPSFTILNGYTLSVMPQITMNCNTITNKGTAANLIIQEGGQLYHNNTDVQATVMKTITPYTSGLKNGWHLIASPMADNTDMNMVSDLLSNEYDLYYYDEPTAYWINQEKTSNNFTELASGKGYLYANSENITLGFAGALKNGNASVTISPLSFQGTNLKGFNLIGNPFARNVTSYTAENVNGAGCFRMNDLKDELIVSEISESNPLKPAEGVFVLATGEDASVTFNSQTRSEVKRTGSINVELTENGLTTDRLIVKRSEEDNNLTKLSLSDNRTKLFASENKQELAVVVCNGNEQPVNFKTNKNGNYTIEVTVNDLDVDYLHLIDNLTGEDVDLLATPSYSFNARITDYASRFRLVFEPNANEENNDSFAFISEGSFIIANEGSATLQIVDMTGRILSSETIYDSFTKPINLSKGVYILRLINGDNMKTQKIVIR